VRETGAFAGFALVLALTNRKALRLCAHEVPLLVVFDVCGLAFVQWFYFIAIHWLAIGSRSHPVLATLLVALWARFVGHEEVRRGIWIALALATHRPLARGRDLERDRARRTRCRGLPGAALSYAPYILVAEHAVATRDPISLSCYGFFFASVFWAAVQPWWSFPDGFVGLFQLLGGGLVLGPIELAQTSR
jgi:hypothetical protein